MKYKAIRFLGKGGAAHAAPTDDQGQPSADTLCGVHKRFNTYPTITGAQQVTCKRCLKLLPEDAEQVQPKEQPSKLIQQPIKYLQNVNVRGNAYKQYLVLACGHRSTAISGSRSLLKVGDLWYCPKCAGGAP